MSLFLTHDELEEVTGAKQLKSQQQRLTELGLVWRLRADGALLVLRGHLENTFGVSHAAAGQRRVEPEFGNAR